MRRVLQYGAGIFIMAAVLLSIPVPGRTQQQDYRGWEQIENQAWKMEFTICSDGQDNFSIRIPYPNYTYNGEWADYSTEAIEISATGDCGPVLTQLIHYNRGYSNEGVWMQFVYPCYNNYVTITIKQTANLNLPGLDRQLAFFTNNPWMYGNDIIDIDSPVISSVLSEALTLAGDWHSGNRSVPEKIVNWMNLNMTWCSTPTVYPKTASTVLTERSGDCDEWAHAACTLLIKAGIAAKVVLTGTIPTSNSTTVYFDNSNLHLCVAYWDGYGWILIDPQKCSGFTIINRVIMGTDQDIRNLEIKYDPDYLKYYVSGVSYDYESGNYSGGLSWHGWRTNACGEDILEHDEGNMVQLQGSEPVDNIIPNVVTDAYNAERLPGTPTITNYPNPFNPATTFTLDITTPGMVNVDLYSVDGRFVAKIFNGYVEKGQRQIVWKSHGIRSGVYVARFQSPEGITSCKVIILR